MYLFLIFANILQLYFYFYLFTTVCACVPVCKFVYVSAGAQRQKEGIEFPEAGVMVNFEFPSVGAESQIRFPPRAIHALNHTPSLQHIFITVTISQEWEAPFLECIWICPEMFWVKRRKFYCIHLGP